MVHPTPSSPVPYLDQTYTYSGHIVTPIIENPAIYSTVNTETSYAPCSRTKTKQYRHKMKSCKIVYNKLRHMLHPRETIYLSSHYIQWNAVRSWTNKWLSHRQGPWHIRSRTNTVSSERHSSDVQTEFRHEWSVRRNGTGNAFQSFSQDNDIDTLTARKWIFRLSDDPI